MAVIVKKAAQVPNPLRLFFAQECGIVWRRDFLGLGFLAGAAAAAPEILRFFFLRTPCSLLVAVSEVQIGRKHQISGQNLGCLVRVGATKKPACERRTPYFPPSLSFFFLFPFYFFVTARHERWLHFTAAELDDCSSYLNCHADIQGKAIIHTFYLFFCVGTCRRSGTLWRSPPVASPLR